MSFTVKGASDNTVYSLPYDISNAGTVLTYPASGTTTTWSNISSHHIPGTITMWYLNPSSGDTLQANNNGFSPKINGTVQSDWYLCDGSRIGGVGGFLVPDMTECVPVGSSHGQYFKVDGNTQITQNIPTPSHSHVYQFTQSQGVGVTTQASGAHNHQSQSAAYIEFAKANVEDKSNQKAMILDINGIRSSGNVYGAISTSSSVHTNHDTHTHGAQITIPHINTNTSNTGENKKFNHYKMYYIIYLP